MFQGSLKFQGCFKGVLRVFQGDFNNNLRKFQGRSREVNWMFFKFKNAIKFQGCFEEIFKGVSRVIQKNFHVAWNSSQLPEQKEGLLD